MPKQWQLVVIGLIGVMIVLNIIMASLGLLGLNFLEALFVVGTAISVIGYIGFQLTLRKP